MTFDLSNLSEGARSRIQTMALCSSMVGTGFGLGVIWTAALTMTAAPEQPPPWAVALTAEYQQLTLIGGALLLGGTAILFGIEYAETELDVWDASS